MGVSSPNLRGERNSKERPSSGAKQDEKRPASASKPAHSPTRRLSVSPENALLFAAKRPKSPHFPNRSSACPMLSSSSMPPTPDASMQASPRGVSHHHQYYLGASAGDGPHSSHIGGVAPPLSPLMLQTMESIVFEMPAVLSAASTRALRLPRASSAPTGGSRARGHHLTRSMPKFKGHSEFVAPSLMMPRPSSSASLHRFPEHVRYAQVLA